MLNDEVHDRHARAWRRRPGESSEESPMLKDRQHISQE
jgi:hypothetical protein